MNKILFIIVTSILYFNSIAIADVYVQPAETILNENVKIKAGNYVYYKFTLNEEEQLKINILVNGGLNNIIDVRLVDMHNFQMYTSNQQYSYISSVSGSVQKTGNYDFIAPKTNIYYLILDNRKALFAFRNVDIKVVKISNNQTESSLNIQKEYENNYNGLKKIFTFNDFNINVKVCGFENAFSNPDITMCIELIDSLKKQNLSKAINFVFLHEVSHSLLNIWGYPTYDNEDVADELATVLTIMAGHEDVALEAAEYWSEQLSKTSAISKLYIDDRHTISPQRARNIINWLNKKPELISRWVNLLLPKMTNQSLKQIAKNKNIQKNNPFLQEIERRKLLKEWDNKS
ncbi:MAG: hypothetical protein A2552_02870 [Sulfuricurvum sp. RIFOXYD2_FULL_44_160]|uniref:Uncharacterized protein n=1 Tax=Sulfuricurvum kujiense TaxID=148813 RepID=A0A2D3WBY4_9BACT|nr:MULTISPECIES: DUF1883 domain-containing protein [Sulfuricurvum]OHD98784.1 MAG: hypothetical protein A2552_02870 [Sulfuricurvum sp. RIFOXYD2_FULL_44_160]DAB37928.1 MAG TPA: hypothetical protein CFH83_08640 [Sulfuricurvum kujiense]